MELVYKDISLLKTPDRGVFLSIVVMTSVIEDTSGQCLDVWWLLNLIRISSSNTFKLSVKSNSCDHRKSVLVAGLISFEL